MNNNDILRRLRYTFDFNDTAMIALFGLGGETVTRAEVSDWLKKEDDPAFQTCNDKLFATFLNGIIKDMRGEKEGEQQAAETQLTNNMIFRKLRIALNLQADDVLKIMASVNYILSKHELSAFFRKIDHKHYRICKNQILRNFLNGLQLKYRDISELKQKFDDEDMDEDLNTSTERTSVWAEK